MPASHQSIHSRPRAGSLARWLRGSRSLIVTADHYALWLSCTVNLTERRYGPTHPLACGPFPSTPDTTPDARHGARAIPIFGHATASSAPPSSTAS